MAYLAPRVPMGKGGNKYSAGKELGLEGGLLCQLVHSPDYNIFPKSAVFESKFIQVTRKGKWVDITNVPTIVTMGVTSSDPCLPLPNVLLMAKHRRVPSCDDDGETPRKPVIDLTRMLPLRYVRLSVHDARQRILRILTVTRKVYYMQLHQDHPNAVFALWSRLADILQRGLSITTKDPAIRIRHSLVPSGSSPSSSGSSAECSESHSVMKRVSKKMSDVFSHISGKPPKKNEKKRRVSFQTEVDEELSTLSNDLKLLFDDMPPSMVCARCHGRLRKSPTRRSSNDSGASYSDPDLLPWMDGQSYGLWQQETPSWLQPLCRLSSLAAAECK